MAHPYAEAPFDAVIREVAEETGYDSTVERLAGARAESVMFRGPCSISLSTGAPL